MYHPVECCCSCCILKAPTAHKRLTLRIPGSSAASAGHFSYAKAVRLLQQCPATPVTATATAASLCHISYENSKRTGSIAVAAVGSHKMRLANQLGVFGTSAADTSLQGTPQQHTAASVCSYQNCKCRCIKP
jgi:hypothetical protein